MKIVIELEVDQEAYDGKYGPGTEWWLKYNTETTYYPNGEPTTTTKPASDYYFAPEKLRTSWDAMLRDILTEGLYDWTQLHEEAPKITITIP